MNFLELALARRLSCKTAPSRFAVQYVREEMPDPTTFVRSHLVGTKFGRCQGRFNLRFCSNISKAMELGRSSASARAE